MEAVCPYCDDEHTIPEDCLYGGTFLAPCGETVEVGYDESWDEESGEEHQWRWLAQVGHS